MTGQCDMSCASYLAVYLVFFFLFGSKAVVDLSIRYVWCLLVRGHSSIQTPDSFVRLPFVIRVTLSNRISHMMDLFTTLVVVSKRCDSACLQTRFVALMYV